MTDWQKVFSVEQSYKAEIVKDILENSNLRPVIISKRDSSYTNFGHFEVHVPADQVIRAMRIIESDVDLR
ncbi:MAG: DUF2007 domain-containing protein [Bacteroidota bacterium]